MSELERKSDSAISPRRELFQLNHEGEDEHLHLGIPRTKGRRGETGEEKKGAKRRDRVAARKGNPPLRKGPERSMAEV